MKRIGPRNRYGSEDEGPDLDQRKDQITQAMLDTTRQIRVIAEETNQIDVDTLIILHR